MAKPFVNSVDPDQMLHSVAFDLGLHCQPITLLGVSRLPWDNGHLPVEAISRVYGTVILFPKYNLSIRQLGHGLTASVAWGMIIHPSRLDNGNARSYGTYSSPSGFL